jgi:nucleoside-diphosphate-sugar epimerase
MASVVVTGGLGNAGRWVVDHLDNEGWDVTCIDLSTPPGAGPGGASIDGIEFRAADLTNQGEAWELIEAAAPETVVHMAAVPMVGLMGETRTFDTNVTSCWNVMMAAGRVGADLVWTSSNSTYGTVFADPPWVPDYLPLDESHPLRPEDAYGTSKVLGEEIGAMVARRYGSSVVSLRPPLIQAPGEYQTADIRAGFDPESADRNGGFWSYVDVRDVARAVECSLTTDIDGHEPFLIAAAENYLDRPTAEVIEAVFGRLPTDCELDGDGSAYTTAKAQDRLGWTPTHNWRTAEDEAVPEPTFG